MRFGPQEGTVVHFLPPNNPLMQVLWLPRRHLITYFDSPKGQIYMFLLQRVTLV